MNTLQPEHERKIRELLYSSNNCEAAVSAVKIANNKLVERKDAAFVLANAGLVNFHEMLIKIMNLFLADVSKAIGEENCEKVFEFKSLPDANCAGMLEIVSEDDEHLKDFEEYMH